MDVAIHVRMFQSRNFFLSGARKRKEGSKEGSKEGRKDGRKEGKEIDKHADDVLKS